LGRALMNVGRTLYRNVSTRPAVPVWVHYVRS
jgi:hypothetical protein